MLSARSYEWRVESAESGERAGTKSSSIKDDAGASCARGGTAPLAKTHFPNGTVALSRFGVL